MKIFEVLSNTPRRNPYSSQQIVDAVKALMSSPELKKMADLGYTVNQKPLLLKKGTVMFMSDRTPAFTINPLGYVRRYRGKSAAGGEWGLITGHEVDLPMKDLLQDYELMIGKILGYIERSKVRKEKNNEKQKRVDNAQHITKNDIPATYEDIMLWAEKFGVSSPHVNKKTLELSGNIARLKTPFGDRLPVTFNRVNDFYAAHCGLKTLEGCPKQSTRFDVSYNFIESFEHAPKRVKSFTINGNKLVSLKGAPQCEMFSASDNQITSMEGISVVVNLYLDKNFITSLDHLPEVVQYVSLSKNKITSIESTREYRFIKRIDLSDNPITSLSGIHKIFKIKDGILRIANCPIKRGLLSAALAFDHIQTGKNALDDIIRKHTKERKNKSQNEFIMDLQEELLEAGFDDELVTL